MHHHLAPRNKYAWIEPLDEANKIGMIFTPGNVSNQYRLAKLLAFDSNCDESKGYEVGQIVLYDTLGAVEHRIGNRMYTTVRMLNFLAVVMPPAEST